MSESNDGGFRSRDKSGGEATAGPFGPALNSVLGEAFGTSLADLSVTRGVDDAIGSIGADATTSGSKISLSSSIREDLHDPYSMNVIGHEVAHALAGGGSGKTLIDRDGDPGESAADAAGLAFGHFAEDRMSGPPPKLSPAHGGHAQVHRHNIRGPWNFNDPVHETMTAETLKRAGMIDGNSTYESPDAWEYSRGVMWNDDPRARLFDDVPGQPTNDYSSGVAWGSEFSAGENEAKSGKTFGVGDPILKRSHFGDLQFLHGMAPDEEDPAVTKQKMMMWAEFTTQVAEGHIKGDAKLSELALKNPMFKQLLGGDASLKDTDVNKLFAMGGPAPVGGGAEGGNGATAEPGAKPYMPDLKKRALGSLLHMIQDSYAEGHVEREELGDGRLGQISNFHAYGHQGHDEHSKADGVPEGPGNFVERLKAKPGAEDAIEHGSEVAMMIKAGMPVAQVLEFLDKNTFATAPGITPAAPGEKFKQKPAPPAPPPAPFEYGPKY